MSQLAPTEILALAKIIDELDYYQLLHLQPGAAAREVKRAYHATSRAFHPDVNRRLAPELRDAVQIISKRISEAYSVLRDPRRRQSYDRALAEGRGVRMQLSQAASEAERTATEQRAGRTPQGRQFFRLAENDLARGDLDAAARNLQTALTFEPDNTGFKEMLDDLRKRRK